MEVTQRAQFMSTLIPERAYRISGFTCIPTDNWQQTLENKTTLLFTQFTKFDPIPATGFAYHYFNFVAYNHLHYRVVDPEDKSKKEYPVLTDYIGCYIESGEKEKWGNPNKMQKITRRVEIQNLKYRDQLQLSSTPATHYYINPNIPELEQYQTEYREAFNLNPPLQIMRQPYQNKEQEKTRNRIPLAILLREDRNAYQGVRFTCEGIITGLNTSRDWYYPSCTMCSSKVHFNTDVFECRIHGPIVSPTYRYNFKAYLTDGTETAMFTFFSPKADNVVGIDCESLVKSLPTPNPLEFPEKLFSIVGKKHIFQFHFNTSTKQQPIDFIFNDILEKPVMPQQIAQELSSVLRD